jgi:hypothetical protein
MSMPDRSNRETRGSRIYELLVSGRISLSGPAAALHSRVSKSKPVFRPFPILCPVTVSAIVAKLLQTADFGDTSAIILPLLAAVLTAKSKGMQAIGSIWSALANLSGLISERFGRPV